MVKPSNLYTAQELEEHLGKKYFYRQGAYRLAEDGKISSYQVEGVLYFSSQEVVLAILNRLAQRIRNRFPWITIRNLRVKFDEEEGKKITVYGFPGGRKIVADAENETEEDLLNKVEKIGKGVTQMPEDIPVGPEHEPHGPEGHHGPHGHGPHRHGPPPPPLHHEEMMGALRRIEDRLARIEEKVG